MFSDRKSWKMGRAYEKKKVEKQVQEITESIYKRGGN